MTETVTNYRPIDRLKALAIEQGFTNEDAKQFDKLSKTATWEALLETYSIPLQVVDTVNRSVDSKAQSLDTGAWTNNVKRGTATLGNEPQFKKLMGNGET
jgi:hypothetical protein